jgi:predicted lipid-binding transport protein (Tim44 family)
MLSKVGRSRTWTALTQTGNAGTQRHVSVTVTGQGGDTVIRVDEPLNKLAGALFGGLMGGFGGGGTGIWFGIGMGVFHSLLVSIGCVMTALSLSYGLARKLFQRAAAKRMAEHDAMLDRMVTAVSETAG